MNRDPPRSGYDNDFHDNGYNGVDGRVYGYANATSTQFSAHAYGGGYGQEVQTTTTAVTRGYYADQNDMYMHESQLDYMTTSSSNHNEQYQQEYAYQPERYPSHLRHTGTRASRSSFTYPVVTEPPVDDSLGAPPYYAPTSRMNSEHRTSNNSSTSSTRPRQQRRKVLRFRDKMVEEFTTETYFQTPSRPSMYPSGASFRLYHPEELPCPVLDQLPRSDAVTKHLRNCMLMSGELGVTTRWTLMPSTKFTLCELYPNEMVICRDKTKSKGNEPVALTGIMVEILSPLSMSLRVAHTQKEMVRLSVREGQELLLQEWYWMLQVAMAMKVDVADANGGNGAAKKKESKTRSVWVVRSVDEDNEPSYSKKAARYISNALAGAEVQVLHNGEVGSRLLAERINEHVHGRTLRESVFLGRHVLGEDQFASRAMRRKLAYDLFVQRGRIKRLVLVVEEELLAVMVQRAMSTGDVDELGNGFNTSMLDMCNGVEFAVDMKTGDTKIVAAFG